jgi:hypothetical protein
MSWHQVSTRANANGVADQTRRGRDVELPHGRCSMGFHRPHSDVEDFRDLVVRVTFAHQLHDPHFLVAERLSVPDRLVGLKQDFGNVAAEVRPVDPNRLDCVQQVPALRRFLRRSRVPRPLTAPQ